MGVAAVILKTVFSSWINEHIQKLQSSPHSTGEIRVKQALSNDHLRAPVLPYGRARLTQPGFLGQCTEEVMGSLRACPTLIFSNVKPQMLTQTWAEKREENPHFQTSKAS